MALGSPAEVIRPAMEAMIAAYPSRDVEMVCVVMTSMRRQMQMTISMTTDMMPMATMSRERDDTPVLLCMAFAR